MAHKRVQRVILVDCGECQGRGYVPTKNGYVPCSYPGCFGGQVERVVNEIVYVEDEAQTK